MLSQQSTKFKEVTANLDAEQIVADYNNGRQNDDVVLYNVDLIRKYGFKAIKHIVQTEDGYLLTLYNIPNNGPAVFLNHGTLGSSDDWLLGGPQKALGFILASKGYDVWLGNARGNKYSKLHTTLRPHCEEFWDFTFDEMGRYDLPTCIDYILNLRDQEKLSYIGYDQGTTAFFVLCSELPEYNEKISVMIALSPIAWVLNIRSPIINAITNDEIMDFYLRKAVGSFEVEPKDIFINEASARMCNDSLLTQVYCNNIEFLLNGFCLNHLDVKDLPVYHSHYPAGTSMKLLSHYAQEVDSGQFRKYDYDGSTNFDRYGSFVPPSYRTQDITAPIAIFYSDNDAIANLTDVETLIASLPNIVEHTLVENYCHVDFKWGATAKDDVYIRILELLTQYSSR